MGSRLLRSIGSLFRFVLFAAGGLAIMAIGAVQIPGAVGDWVSDAININPFDRDAENRTGPAVLHELIRRSEFKAARGYYEVVVDIDPGGSFPDFIDGDRVIYVGKGTVEAVVDFSELDERRIVASEDGTSVSVTLPAPTIGKPHLDIKASEVVIHDEGFLTKWRGSDLERKAQLEAEGRLAAAANGEGKLLDLAKESTRTTLYGMFRASGYKNISIEFDETPASRA